MPSSASALVADLEASGLGPRQVARWADGRWQSHIAGHPFNDFPIEPGAGYFLRTGAGGSWRPVPEATPGAAGPVTVRLQAGWSLVALPPEAESRTAASLAAELIAARLEPSFVVGWRDGAWESHIVDSGAGDFPIEPGRGYFVRSANYGVWQPQ